MGEVEVKIPSIILYYPDDSLLCIVEKDLKQFRGKYIIPQYKIQLKDIKKREK